MNDLIGKDSLFNSLSNSRLFCLVVTDQTGRIVSFNRCFIDWFGGDAASEKFDTQLSQADKVIYQKAVAGLLKQKTSPIAVMLRCAAPEKCTMHWELTLSENGDQVIHIGHNDLLPEVRKDWVFGMDNEKIRTLVNHIPGAVYRCRGDEAITLEFFSDEIVSLTEHPMDYFINDREKAYSALVHAADKERFMENMRRAIDSKEKFEIEYRLITKSGKIKWVFESGKVNHDPESGMTYVDGYIFDNSHRKQMEADLARREDEVRRLALVAHNTTNAVMITDADEYIIWINDAYTRMTGYTLEEIKDKKIGYSLEGENGNEAIRKKIRTCLNQRLPYKEEFVSFAKDGTQVWLEVDCHPLQDAAGNHIGFMAVENDITRIKQTITEQEELLQRLTLATDSAEIGIFEIDMGSREVIWDDRMYELYGCSKEPGQNLYKVFFNAMHPDDAEMMTKIIGQLLSQKKEIDGAIYRILLPDGNTRYIESHAIIKKSESGRVLSLIGTNRDVSKSFLVQEKIKMQNKVLREIAIIQSHEVRRPLANILGVIEILQSSGTMKDFELFDHLAESAKELDKQIRMIVNKANEMDDEVFR